MYIQSRFLFYSLKLMHSCSSAFPKWKKLFLQNPFKKVLLLLLEIIRRAMKVPLLDQSLMGDHVPQPFDSEKLPLTLASSGIQRFLRVANLIESEEPRVAYLCRFHAFEVAHNLDRNSNGQGVRQFKTSLLQRLEQDEEVTFRKRKERTDLRELRRAYLEYKGFIIKHGGESNLENRKRLTKARAIASVLFEVLDPVSRPAGVQALAGSESSGVKSELFVSYNILPLDQGGIHHAIMQLPEGDLD
ncbi:putative callose synthase 8 [Lycium ferocissimum]|uniref:putative callose synthase 8 n=1 Tax=Lycium ferocissimum TaxID=112874 RepID=UPI0028162C4B|nr:putative callose synthase 8 [Lycium ferocissimum]